MITKRELLEYIHEVDEGVGELTRNLHYLEQRIDLLEHPTKKVVQPRDKSGKFAKKKK